MPIRSISVLLIMALFCNFPEIPAKSISGGSPSYGCTTMDHSACDELCKTDSFWYGHCSAWDGTDFQCKCFEYKAPLDAKICSNYKDYCNTLCTKKNQQGGYCYPALSQKDTRGIPQCQCFKDINDLF